MFVLLISLYNNEIEKINNDIFVNIEISSVLYIILFDRVMICYIFNKKYKFGIL